MGTVFKEAFSKYKGIHIRDLGPTDEECALLVRIAQRLNEVSKTLFFEKNEGNVLSAIEEVERLMKKISTNSKKTPAAEPSGERFYQLAYNILAFSEKRYPDLLALARIEDIDMPEEVYRQMNPRIRDRQQPKFRGDGFILDHRSKVNPEVSIPTELIFNKWNLESFGGKRTRSSVIGQAKQERFSTPCSTQLYNLLIKVPGRNEAKIPLEMEHHRELLQTLVDHASSLIQNWVQKDPGRNKDVFYFYLSVNQNLLKTGETQRYALIHPDGIQGPQYVLGKLPAGWGYLISDVAPTAFYDQVFDFSGFDENTDDLYDAIAKMADEKTVYTPEPYDVVFLTKYDIHRSPQMPQTGNRTLMRFDVSAKIFDEIGNTVNPLFQGEQLGSIRYPWRFIPRPIPELKKKS